jgi:hypothetical protein
MYEVSRKCKILCENICDDETTYAIFVIWAKGGVL